MDYFKSWFEYNKPEQIEVPDGFNIDLDKEDGKEKTN